MRTGDFPRASEVHARALDRSAMVPKSYARKKLKLRKESFLFDGGAE